MLKRTIRITGLIASARGPNRLRFEIIEKGKETPVVYPQTRRRDEDQDSLAVEDPIFSLAQSIYYDTTQPDRLAVAELWTNNQCCCCTKIHVDGILTLSPVEPAPTTTPSSSTTPPPETAPPPTPQSETTPPPTPQPETAPPPTPST